MPAISAWVPPQRRGELESPGTGHKLDTTACHGQEWVHPSDRKREPAARRLAIPGLERDRSLRSTGVGLVPGVRAGVGSGGGNGEAGQEVVPAGGVDGCLAGWQAPVDQPQVGAGLDGGRVNSTSVAPGGRSVLPATPQLTTTRRGGSTSR